MPPDIRLLQEHDWHAMTEIFVQAGRAAWSHILPLESLEALTPPDRWHPRQGGAGLVALLEREVVGFVCLRASADEDATTSTGEVDALYVLPSVWGSGVGRVLLTAATRRLAEGFSEATLWTEHRNYRPLEFYRAAGWRVDGAERRRVYRGTNLLEIRHRIVLR